MGEIPLKLQMLQPSQEEMRMMLEILAGREVHPGKPLEQRLKRDAPFGAGERCADTKVDAEAERHVIA